jgi:hypothetical protein
VNRRGRTSSNTTAYLGSIEREYKDIQDSIILGPGNFENRSVHNSDGPVQHFEK